MRWGRGGVYPGYGDGRVGWEGYTGTHPATVPGSHIQSISGLKPYPRPNEGKSKVFSEVSEIGSRKGPDRVPEWPQNDLPGPYPRLVPDGPQMTLRSLYPDDPQMTLRIRTLFSVLLTIAELKDVRAKDWIRPPSRCQECTNSLIYYRF